MFGMIWSMAMAVVGCIMYNICSKEVPDNIHPFASLTVSYSVATILSLLAFFVLSEQKNLAVEYAKANWTSWGLGLTIMCQEVAYIFLYRVGWKVSTGSLIANIVSSILLIFVGLLVFSEVLTIKQGIGIIVASIGLVLINLPSKSEKEVAETTAEGGKTE